MSEKQNKKQTKHQRIKKGSTSTISTDPTTLVKRYQFFIHSSEEAIWRFESDTPIPSNLPSSQQIDLYYKHVYLAECNNATAIMYGVTTAKELIGKRLNEFLIQDDPINIEYLTNFILSNYKLNNVQSHERDTRGEERYFINSLVGEIHNGCLIGAWGSQRDITALKKAEESFRTKESLYKIVVEHSHEGITLNDIQGKYIYVSPGFQKILGYTTDELIGTSGFDSIHPEDKDRMTRVAAQALKGEPINAICRLQHKKGHYVTVEGIAGCIFDVNNQPSFLMSTFHDITERSELEQRKNEFIAIASHELKTPVTSLKAYTQVLETRSVQHSDENVQGLLSRMNVQIDKITNLIEDLLDVTKIEQGKIKFNPTIFTIDDLLIEVCDQLQHVTTQHKLECINQANKPAIVNADRDRIAQVITNLILNATKYSPAQNKVIITLESLQDEYKVSVQDFGIGIPPDEHQQIFERFYRSQKPKQNTYPGLGLGLYISAEIIKRHSGTIGVKSEEGNGALFYFTLPKATI